jgi:hypothetical protein
MGRNTGADAIDHTCAVCWESIWGHLIGWLPARALTSDGLTADAYNRMHISPRADLA